MEKQLEGNFRMITEMKPRGDQPQAIEALSEGVVEGLTQQVLLGVTGSGKTFTMGGVIERVQRPTLVLAHNKTLAAQLTSEFKELFPENAVEYFVSYYDYYQPEAYIASSDTYIEKDSSINDEIDRMRHSATAALRERRDVIVVSSVSCIYSLGDPSEYEGLSISLREGQTLERDALLRQLVDVQYQRNDIDFSRGTFRVRGDTVEIIPIGLETQGIRVTFFGDEIERISEIHVLTGELLRHLRHVMIFPASHYATSPENMEGGIAAIERDLEIQIKQFQDEGKLLEAQRIAQRTRYDIEMMREVGYCTGIENYSRYFDGRKPGDSPYTLLDYFPKDFMLMIDESHVTLPQVRAMYNGDRARKENLVGYGFRLPSAFDNRPLTFAEFEERIKSVLYVSATPGPYELGRTQRIVEQIIRPTGLVDPEIIVRPAQGQVDDLLGEVQKVTEKGQRVLVTTLTKKMAENLTDYFRSMEIKVEYLHSDVETLERIRILHDLRAGKFDVLVGINLLREGLDLPEVALVAILDADKEGFLRSETSLIQTIGRAARNVDGRVIMYADHITDSMRHAIDETQRRREIQNQYNEEHGIVPQTVLKKVHELLEITRKPDEDAPRENVMDENERMMAIEHLEDRMLEAAAALDFERAATLRDQILVLRGEKPAEDVTLPKNKRRPKKKFKK